MKKNLLYKYNNLKKIQVRKLTFQCMGQVNIFLSHSSCLQVLLDLNFVFLDFYMH